MSRSYGYVFEPPATATHCPVCFEDDDTCNEYRCFSEQHRVCPEHAYGG